MVDGDLGRSYSRKGEPSYVTCQRSPPFPGRSTLLLLPPTIAREIPELDGLPSGVYDGGLVEPHSRVGGQTCKLQLPDVRHIQDRT